MLDTADAAVTVKRVRLFNESISTVACELGLPERTLRRYTVGDSGSALRMWFKNADSRPALCVWLLI